MATDSSGGGARRRRRRLLVALLALCGCQATEVEAPRPFRTAMDAAEKALRARQFDEARAQFTAALQTASAAGDPAGRMAAGEGLAAACAMAGDLDAADSLYTDLLAFQRQRFDADSLAGARLVHTLGSLGEINLGRGKVDRAEGFFAAILQLRDDGAIDLRPEEALLAYTLDGLGAVRRERGDLAAADSLSRRAMGLKLYAQGFTDYVDGDLQQAESSFQRALSVQERLLGSSHVDPARTALALGRLCDVQGRADEAAAYYRRAADTYARAGSAPAEQATALEDLAALEAARDPERAAGLRQRAAELRGPAVDR